MWSLILLYTSREQEDKGKRCALSRTEAQSVTHTRLDRSGSLVRIPYTPPKYFRGSMMIIETEFIPLSPTDGCFDYGYMYMRLKHPVAWGILLSEVYVRRNSGKACIVAQTVIR